jgi:arylsulfatase A-like enzyme
MNRRDFLALLGQTAALGALTSRSWGAAAPPARKPNILLFLVDDMGWQDTSVPFWKKPTRFNRHFRTPNMERLARQGIRFTNAYSHAVCSPTRTSIMTGHNPARHHVSNWTLRTDKDTSGAWGRTASPPAWRKGGLQPEDLTLPKLLQQAGYFTIHSGKAHWGAMGTPGSNPENLGFDINIAGHAAGGPGSYQGKEDYGNNRKDSPWGVPGLEKYHGKKTHLTDALTKETKAAISTAVKADKPFYCYMAHYAIHAPIQPHQRFMKGYKDRAYDDTDIDIPVEEERYASMVEGMDASLGALLKHIEKLGEAENTLVIFTSDNGGLSVHARNTTPYGTGPDTHNYPLKAGKGSAYEGGTRVPFIAAWAKPKANHPMQQTLPIQAQAVSDQPVLCEDLFPTLLGIGQAAAPLPQDYPLDGRDIRPYLLQRKTNPERPILFHYPHVWGPKGLGYEPHSALRVGDWKVIYFYNPKRWELYNLKDDLSEKNDLAQADPQRLKTMARQLVDGLTQKGAQWPIDRETGEEERIKLPG